MKYFHISDISGTHIITVRGISMHETMVTICSLFGIAVKDLTFHEFLGRDYCQIESDDRCFWIVEEAPFLYAAKRFFMRLIGVWK